MMTDLRQIKIPTASEPPEQILEEIRNLKQGDVAWKEGKVWSLVYDIGGEHSDLLKSAHGLLSETNYLNPFAFKSLEKMEQEVVHMTISMLHGDPSCVGVMTSGGTESILLAVWTYKQFATSRRKHITHPEIVAPATIHPAFDKAAMLFGLKIRKAKVDEGMSAIPDQMEKLINTNTVLIVASAPSYPNGILDPIEEIASMAQRHGIPFHVDACIGGFMLPWIEKSGQHIPLWDFRVAGVTSISADVHKFGFGAKGASVIMYRSMAYLHHQFIVSTDFPGGIYVSPTLMGTRPGGPIAAAWAAVKHLGEEGYLKNAYDLICATQKVKEKLVSTERIRIIGEPCMNILSYTTINNSPDIYVVADQLESKKWLIDRQQFPPSIHMTVLPTNINAIDEYIHDLKEAIAFGLNHPEATSKGNAAIYGLMARIPFRGVVEKNVIGIMENMYGATHEMADEGATSIQSTESRTAFWLGKLNRLLEFVKRKI